MKPELLAPAGDLEKVRIALLYGADAVYIGGDSFSLRARASKFNLETIKEATDLAHSMNKKLYVTMNMVPYNEDLKLLDEYLLKLDEAKVDAIICSSPAIIDRAKFLTSLPIHLSTQVSTVNSLQANFWSTQGVSRVVLGRECTLEEIKQIQKNAIPELEVFIHGGMCVSYSGRCTLSNYMTSRDANRGGCAHSCRWKYRLFENNQMISEDYDFEMSSKDLQTIEFIPSLCDIGIASLKIEGRMKSIHYIATVVNAYRRVIDDYDLNQLKPMSFYENEIKKAENRLTSFGFMKGMTTSAQQLYHMRSEIPTKEFVGLVLDYDPFTKKVTFEQRNYFEVGDTLEWFSPTHDIVPFVIQQMFDESGEEVTVARHPLQHLSFYSEIEMTPYDIIRKVLE